MATLIQFNDKISHSMEKTGQRIFPQISTDITVQVGAASFSLHKFMLVAKSNRIRKLIHESGNSSRIDLSDIPGGAEAFEQVAKFCYSVNFDITVHNVAVIRCAAEYLEMTDKYCADNLIGMAEDFLSRVALRSLSGSLAVLKSCEDLLPVAEDLRIIHRCVEIASAKVCVEANFPSRSPPNWWTEELTILGITSFKKIIVAMKSRGAKSPSLASSIITYADRSLHDVVHKCSENVLTSPDSGESNVKATKHELLEGIVALMPSGKSLFPISFLCRLLRTAIFLRTETSCKSELERRISAILEHATVDDLLLLSFAYDGERLLDLESLRKIISVFVEKEKTVTVFDADFREVCSTAMQRVTKTLDAYLAEIATCSELTIAKFNGIANLLPKEARKSDDSLYRAVDIYLKAHPTLDEIEREKVCSAMDPLKLSYEARVHASQNKRLPVQIVLHALCYDQLKSRSETVMPDAATARNQVCADESLVKENEALRAELRKMKTYIQDIQKPAKGTSSKNSVKKPSFFSSMSKSFGKLNPFKHGSKDTSNIVDGMPDLTKPRKRRFSIS